MRHRAAAALVAAVAGAAFLGLGSWVSRAGEPPRLLGWEHALVNHGTLAAAWLARSCYPYVLGPLALALLFAAWRLPAWRARILFSIGMALLCWRGADLFQHLFARPRRIDWVFHHETAFSYPSSHAAIATGFYALWAVMLWSRDAAPAVRRSAPPLLLLLAIAIGWSRLALGAHYLTDLIGGALLGVALVAATLALVPIKLLAPPAGRS